MCHLAVRTGLLEPRDDARRDRTRPEVEAREIGCECAKIVDTFGAHSFAAERPHKIQCPQRGKLLAQDLDAQISDSATPTQSQRCETWQGCRNEPCVCVDEIHVVVVQGDWFTIAQSLQLRAVSCKDGQTALIPDSMAPTYLKIEEIGEPLGEIAERQTADVPCIIDVQLSQQRAVLGNAVNAVRFVFKWKRAFRVKRRQSGTLRKNRLEAGCLMVAVADGARTPDLDSVIADVQRRQMREAFADVSQAFRGEKWRSRRTGQVQSGWGTELPYFARHAATLRTQKLAPPPSP